MKKIILAMSVCVSNLAIAEWSMIGNPDTYETDFIPYIDFESVRINYNAKSLLMFATKHEYVGNSDEIGKKNKIQSYTQQWYVSCPNQSYFINASVDYDNKGKVINSWQSSRIPPISEFRYAFPKTIASGVLNQACGYQYPKEFRERIQNSRIALRLPKICQNKVMDNCFEEVMMGKYD